MKSNPNMYCRDWHQCHACGCTYPKKMLRVVVKTDPVLKVSGPAFECIDGAYCDRFKRYRAAELAREADGLKRDISKYPIGGAPHSRKKAS